MSAGSSDRPGRSTAGRILRSETSIPGRGTGQNPSGRFESIRRSVDAETFDETFDPDASGPRTEVLRDTSRTILSRNDSPDIPFTVSLNPYRGCEHGCVYCYARPTHEFLGFSAGLDFESKILVKEDAPALLRAALSKRGYRPEVIAMSGVTDCYQPLEREFKLTRGCLEVLRDFRNPVGVVTKSALVTRDKDLLAELAAFDAAAVAITLTTLDDALAARLEPRASTPRRRLGAIAELTAAGIPVHVICAPVIPGMTEHELPELLAQAASRGARSASYQVVRLAHGLADLFEQWLRDHYPDRFDRVMNRVRAIRGGQRNDPRFGIRMRGEGVFADEIEGMFKVARHRAGLGGGALGDWVHPGRNVAHFRVPGRRQQELF